MPASEAVQPGSQRLIEALARKGVAVTTEDLRAAISIPANIQFKLVRWYWKGQPPAPFEFYGSLETPVHNAGQVIQSILNTRELTSVEVFPYGIPFPDTVIVNVSNEIPGIEG